GRGGAAGAPSEAEPRRAHRLDLLGEPAEDRRVTALEADDAATAAGAIDQQPVDLRLAHAVAARRLAGVDDLGLRRRFTQQRLRNQPIVGGDVRLADAA